MSKERFQTLLEEKGISLSSLQLEQFDIYFKLLVEWNERMNLTAITEEDEVYLKHFYDSITAAISVDFNQPLSVVDVGAGAGFPSIPIKICFPKIKVSIVDSLNKRIGFLNHLASKLGLNEAYFYHDRAELFGQNKEHRERYDIAMARAVARMPVLAELCLPLVKVNGTWIAMKGAGATEELKESQKALELLGGRLLKDDSFRLPIEDSERHIITVKKEKSSPKKYPRKPGTPNKQPLV